MSVNNYYRSPAFKCAVFSDVDGTLVHYPIHLQLCKGGDTRQESTSNIEQHPVNDGTTTTSARDNDFLLHLPPSKTGTRGVISARTLNLCHLLRHGQKEDADYLIDTITSSSSSSNHNGNNSKNGNDNPTTARESTNNRQIRIANGGVPFVLISGMRTTTLFQRLPYLPRADAYVSESGGRIFYPCPPVANIATTSVKEEENDSSSTTTTSANHYHDGLVKDLVIHPIPYPGSSPSDLAPFSLREDMNWRKRISHVNAAGPDGYYTDDNDVNNDGTTTGVLPISSRKGKVWEYARTLMNQGYKIDTHGYSTSFRINRKHQHQQQHMHNNANDSSSNVLVDFDKFLEKCATKEDIPEGLGCSTNLGCVDVYPVMSGKKNCCEYLVKRFLAGEEGCSNTEAEEDDSIDISGKGGRRHVSLKSHALCMCDDDNDIEMALACRAAYLPSVTSESVQRLVDSLRGSPDKKLVVTEDVENGIIETRSTEAALELVLMEVQK